MIYFAKIQLGRFGVLADSHPDFIRELFFIKIGKSDDIKSRLYSLPKECGYPVFILASMPGGLAEEASMHKRFSHLRLQGMRRKRPEWFYPADELMDFIGSLQEIKNLQNTLDLVMTKVYT